MSIQVISVRALSGLARLHRGRYGPDRRPTV